MPVVPLRDGLLGRGLVELGVNGVLGSELMRLSVSTSEGAFSNYARSKKGRASALFISDNYMSKYEIIEINSYNLIIYNIYDCCDENE